MSQESSLRITRLQARAEMLAKARAFFKDKKILEVDCPILTNDASIDAHIDLITAKSLNEIRYLHSSPEFGMKRLLSEGIGDIYQLSHVFREGEYGKKHNPEFTMAEWYRVNISFEQMILETIEFIQLFLGPLPFIEKTFRDVFLHFTDIDYLKESNEDLFAYLKQENIPYYESVLKEGKDALLNLILGHKIEPELGKSELFVLTHYPATQAALAKKSDNNTALRFEVYYQGVELANGYQELSDPIEQKRRFLDANIERISLGKKTLPIDEKFLKALENGLPDCCGVAVGFDRLLMLQLQASTLSEVIPFDWNSA